MKPPSRPSSTTGKINEASQPSSSMRKINEASPTELSSSMRKTNETTPSKPSSRMRKVNETSPSRPLKNMRNMNEASPSKPSSSSESVSDMQPIQGNADVNNTGENSDNSVDYIIETDDDSDSSHNGKSDLCDISSVKIYSSPPNMETKRTLSRRKGSSRARKCKRLVKKPKVSFSHNRASSRRNGLLKEHETQESDSSEWESVSEKEASDENNEQTDRMDGPLFINTDDGSGEELEGTQIPLQEQLEKTIADGRAKNNLSVSNVKSIIWTLLTHDLVKEMLKTRLEACDDEDATEGGVFAPKLTRSKMKEVLEKGNDGRLWPVSPVKLGQSSTAGPSILDVEFADEEDEEDDEYEPSKDAEMESDDESVTSLHLSDIGSPFSFGSPAPSTPSTPITSATSASSTPVTKSTVAVSQTAKDLITPMSPSTSSAQLPAATTMGPPVGLPPSVKGTRQRLVFTSPVKDKAEEDGIARRTRSKLPLTTTSLYDIEEAFVAPDITSDMYDTMCDDSDWQEFLKNLQKFGDIDAPNECMECGEEDDPEFNYSAEVQEIEPDVEEARFDGPFRVSREELNGLLEELEDLFTEDDYSMISLRTNLASAHQNAALLAKKPAAAFVSEVTGQSQTCPSVQRPVSIGKEARREEEPSTAAELAVKIPNSDELSALNNLVSDHQVKLIEEHMRKHVQLTTQMYVLAQGSNDYYPMADTCKTLLTELDRYRQASVAGSRSAFNACNLDGALGIVSSDTDWVSHRQQKRTVQSGEENGTDDKQPPASAPPTAADASVSLPDASCQTVSRKDKLRKIVQGADREKPVKKKTGPASYQSIASSLRPLLNVQKEVLWSSPVFLYPDLLPPNKLAPLDVVIRLRKFNFFNKWEDGLLVLGKEQFKDLKGVRMYKTIHELMMPCKSVDQLIRHFKRTFKDKDNVIMRYKKRRELPEAPQTAEDFSLDMVKAPCDRPDSLLPKWCKVYRRQLQRAQLRHLKQEATAKKKEEEARKEQARQLAEKRNQKKLALEEKRRQKELARQQVPEDESKERTKNTLEVLSTDCSIEAPPAKVARMDESHTDVRPPIPSQPVTVLSSLQSAPDSKPSGIITSHGLYVSLDMADLTKMRRALANSHVVVVGECGGHKVVSMEQYVTSKYRVGDAALYRALSSLTSLTGRTAGDAVQGSSLGEQQGRTDEPVIVDCEQTDEAGKNGGHNGTNVSECVVDDSSQNGELLCQTSDEARKVCTCTYKSKESDTEPKICTCDYKEEETEDDREPNKYENENGPKETTEFPYFAEAHNSPPECSKEVMLNEQEDGSVNPGEERISGLDSSVGKTKSEPDRCWEDDPMEMVWKEDPDEADSSQQQNTMAVSCVLENTTNGTDHENQSYLTSVIKPGHPQTTKMQNVKENRNSYQQNVPVANHNHNSPVRVGLIFHVHIKRDNDELMQNIFDVARKQKCCFSQSKICQNHFDIEGGMVKQTAGHEAKDCLYELCKLQEEGECLQCSKTSVLLKDMFHFVKSSVTVNIIVSMMHRVDYTQPKNSEDAAESPSSTTPDGEDGDNGGQGDTITQGQPNLGAETRTQGDTDSEAETSTQGGTNFEVEMSSTVEVGSSVRNPLSQMCEDDVSTTSDIGGSSAQGCSARALAQAFMSGDISLYSGAEALASGDGSGPVALSGSYALEERRGVRSLTTSSNLYVDTGMASSSDQVSSSPQLQTSLGRQSVLPELMSDSSQSSLHRLLAGLDQGAAGDETDAVSSSFPDRLLTGDSMYGEHVSHVPVEDTSQIHVAGFEFGLEVSSSGSTQQCDLEMQYEGGSNSETSSIQQTHSSERTPCLSQRLFQGEQSYGDADSQGQIQNRQSQNVASTSSTREISEPVSYCPVASSSSVQESPAVSNVSWSNMSTVSSSAGFGNIPTQSSGVTHNIFSVEVNRQEFGISSSETNPGAIICSKHASIATGGVAEMLVQGTDSVHEAATTDIDSSHALGSREECPSDHSRGGGNTCLTETNQGKSTKDSDGVDQANRETWLKLTESAAVTEHPTYNQERDSLWGVEVGSGTPESTAGKSDNPAVTDTEMTVHGTGVSKTARAVSPEREVSYMQYLNEKSPPPYTRFQNEKSSPSHAQGEGQLSGGENPVSVMTVSQGPVSALPQYPQASAETPKVLSCLGLVSVRNTDTVEQGTSNLQVVSSKNLSSPGSSPSLVVTLKPLYSSPAIAPLIHGLQYIQEKSPSKSPRALAPKPGPVTYTTSPRILRRTRGSPKKQQLQKQVRAILPKGYNYEQKMNSPTKTAARTLKRKATLFCQRSPNKPLLPKDPSTTQLAPIQPATHRLTRTLQTSSTTTLPGWTRRGVVLRGRKHRKKEMASVAPVMAAKKVLPHPKGSEEGSQEESDETGSEIEDIALMSQDDSQNEDETGETDDGGTYMHDLMAASTTIGFNPYIKTTPDKDGHCSKQELRRQQKLILLDPDVVKTDPQKDDRDLAWAQLYLNKVKVVMQKDLPTYTQYMDLLRQFETGHTSPVEVYEALRGLLVNYPELLEDFAGFLHPAEALQSRCHVPNQLIHQARAFIRKLEIRYRRRLDLGQKVEYSKTFQKILRTMGRWDFKTKSPARLREILMPLLRNLPQHLHDDFARFFPDLRPPESYMETTDFEDIKLVDSDEEGNRSPDDFEDITFPDENDPYRTRRCPCVCHKESITKRKKKEKYTHCYNCCLKVVGGQLYFQPSNVTTRRPVSATFYDPVSMPLPTDLPPPSARSRGALHHSAIFDEIDDEDEDDLELDDEDAHLDIEDEKCTEDEKPETEEDDEKPETEEDEEEDEDDVEEEDEDEMTEEDEQCSPAKQPRTGNVEEVILSQTSEPPVPASSKEPVQSLPQPQQSLLKESIPQQSLAQQPLPQQPASEPSPPQEPRRCSMEEMLQPLMSRRPASPSQPLPALAALSRRPDSPLPALQTMMPLPASANVQLRLLSPGENNSRMRKRVLSMRPGCQVSASIHAVATQPIPSAESAADSQSAGATAGNPPLLAPPGAPGGWKPPRIQTDKAFGTVSVVGPDNTVIMYNSALSSPALRDSLPGLHNQSTFFPIPQEQRAGASDTRTGPVRASEESSKASDENNPLPTITSPYKNIQRGSFAGLLPGSHPAQSSNLPMSCASVQPSTVEDKKTLTAPSAGTVPLISEDTLNSLFDRMREGQIPDNASSISFGLQTSSSASDMLPKMMQGTEGRQLGSESSKHTPDAPGPAPDMTLDLSCSTVSPPYTVIVNPESPTEDQEETNSDKFEWTSEQDRVILSMVQDLGASPDTYAQIAAKLQNITAQQVLKRVSRLMEFLGPSDQDAAEGDLLKYCI